MKKLNALIAKLNKIRAEKKEKGQKGFTLVELLVVIAILAILASVSVVGYLGFTTQAKQSNAKTELTQVRDYLLAQTVDGSEFTFVETTSPSKLYEDGDFATFGTGDSAKTYLVSSLTELQSTELIGKTANTDYVKVGEKYYAKPVDDTVAVTTKTTRDVKTPGATTTYTLTYTNNAFNLESKTNSSDEEAETTADKNADAAFKRTVNDFSSLTGTFTFTPDSAAKKNDADVISYAYDTSAIAYWHLATNLIDLTA